MTSLLSRLITSGGIFGKQAALLTTSNIITQVVTVAALPLVTRLYNPSEFGEFAVYLSLIALFSTAACLRFDIALLQPQSDRFAINLAALGVAAATTFAAVLGIIVTFYPDQSIGLLGGKQLVQFRYLVLASLWSAACYGTLQSWALRKKWFIELAASRSVYTFAAVSCQLLLGYNGFGTFGLLLGNAAALACSLTAIVTFILARDSHLILAVTTRAAYRAALRYRAYPIYSTPEALFAAAASQVPILLISALSLNAEAGFFLLAVRIGSAPLQLIGQSASQVFMSHAPREMREGTLGKFASQTLVMLLIFGAAPIVIGGIFAPTLVRQVFGEGWQRAGELLLWMTPWLVLQFLAVPISGVMHARSMLKEMFLLQILGFCLRISAPVLAAYWRPDIVVEVFAVTSAGFYALSLVCYLRAASIPEIRQA